MKSISTKLIPLVVLLFLNLYIKAQWGELYTPGYPQLYANGSINAMLVTPQQEVYVGGGFEDGTSQYMANYYYPKWHHLCNVNNYIYAITSSDLGVFAGGYFTDSLGGYYVVQQAGGNYYVAGNTTFNGSIASLTSDKFSNIYAAGEFTNGSNERYVAKFDGAQWTELSNGSNRLMANNSIQSIATDTFGNVYASGNFTNGTGNYYVAKWNGLQWSELGNLNANGIIFRIVTDNSGNVYATGSFTNASGQRYVAKWDGTSWGELGGNNALQANSSIWAIAPDNMGNIYAAGEFSNNSGKKYVAKYNGNTWSELSANGSYLNANDAIFTLACGTDGKVYCGGDFTDSTAHNYVAVYKPVTTGIAGQAETSALQVYPNPFSNAVSLLNWDDEGPSTISLHDVTGKEVYAQQYESLSGHKIQFPTTLADGIYFMQVTNPVTHGTQTVKLLKQSNN